MSTPEDSGSDARVCRSQAADARVPTGPTLPPEVPSVPPAAVSNATDGQGTSTMAAAESSHCCRPPKPRKPVLGQHFHCPIQTSLDDLPKIEVDIHGNDMYYLNVLKELQKREIKIAPFIIQLPGCKVHVTPLGVPFPKKSVTKSDSKGKGKGKGRGKTKTKVKAKGKEEPEKDKIVSSFHIIQLFSSKDSTYSVELLMKDENLYFVAFRRNASVPNGAKNGPGNWYAFSNEIDMLPDFINATKIEMNSNYSDPKLIKPGGSEEALDGIFLQLIHFESQPVVKNEFRQAMYSVMQLYCEGRRSREMQREMSRRIEHREEPSILSELLSKTIHMWKSFSGMVLQPFVDGTIKADLALRGVTGDVLPAEFKTIDDLIGVNGELLIAKLHVRYLSMTESDLNAEEEKAREPGYVKNHPFPVEEEVREGGGAPC